MLTLYKVMHEICAVLRYYAAWNGNFVTMFRDNLSVPYSRVKQFCFYLDYLTLEDVRDRFSRNVDTVLPFYAA
jgi:hypothetical protein